ncbi:MAG: hypothetical protein C0405_10010 [Desulfovibrio sp.]|nr:hypothetical protein [Desulfovibrio sp.]
MLQSKVLIPRPGLVVRDPVTMAPLPPEGAAKPMNTYWRRRLRDGDVGEAAPPQQPAHEKGE